MIVKAKRPVNEWHLYYDRKAELLIIIFDKLFLEYRNKIELYGKVHSISFLAIKVSKLKKLANYLKRQPLRNHI